MVPHEKDSPRVVDLDETVDFEARERKHAGQRDQNLGRRDEMHVQVPERPTRASESAILQSSREERNTWYSGPGDARQHVDRHLRRAVRPAAQPPDAQKGQHQVPRHVDLHDPRDAHSHGGKCRRKRHEAQAHRRQRFEKANEEDNGTRQHV
jgi:hypothetical protein